MMPDDNRPRTDWQPGTRAMPSFHGLAAAFLSGKDSPRDLLERCIATIEAREPEVGAFVVHDFARARAAADASTARWRDGATLSAIDGLPIGLKDVIGTEDFPAARGSEIYAGRPPERDAAVAWALRQGGAVILGKTVTTEFAIGRIGRTRNPLDPRRTPGTSSSGSAAAVGAGMLPVALGSQLISSVMRPASYCGHVGVMPSYGVIRMDGMEPVCPSTDHVGTHTTTLEDAWIVLRHLSRTAGPIPGWRGLHGPADPPAPVKPRRLARLYEPDWQHTDAACRAALEDALKTLSAAGVEIVEPDDDPVLRRLEAACATSEATIMALVTSEMRWPYLDYDAKGFRFGLRLGPLMEKAHAATLEDYHEALGARDELRARFDAAARAYDGFIGLSAASVAAIGLDNMGRPGATAPATCAGLPALTLPVMAAHGLPLGLQLIGASHGEANLFAHAAWIGWTLLDGGAPVQ